MTRFSNTKGYQIIEVALLLYFKDVITSPKDNEEKDIELHFILGSIRYVTFIQEDGKRLSLPYLLLPGIVFEPGDEQETITPMFPNHKVVLTGYNLEQLCQELENERVRLNRVSDGRYSNNEMERGLILGIEIKNTISRCEISRWCYRFSLAFKSFSFSCLMRFDSSCSEMSILRASSTFFGSRATAEYLMVAE